MKSILIYRDTGANPSGIKALVEALKLEGIDQHYEIAWADSKLLSSQEWQKKTQVLIFPGGRDIPYHRACKGIANHHIRSYVEQGGKYFGICAGSYYGCASIEFEKGGPLEVLGDRELKFFPGTARGPAYGNGKFCYYSHRGAQVAPQLLDPKFLSTTTSAAYYYGGCLFVDAADHEGVTVLGRYADIEGQPASIIRCSVGAGEALLCGVHPEYSAEHESAPEIFSPEHLAEFRDLEPQRRQLFRDLMKLLGLH